MALSHILLQVALCNAALRANPQAQLPLRVVVTDKLKRTIVDRAFRVSREDGQNTANVSFDMPWGTYGMSLTMKVGHTMCSGLEEFAVLMDHNRSLNVSMQEGRPKAAFPSLVMGSLPFSFSYVQPTVVALDKTAACNGPVGNSLDAGIATIDDSDGYYASIPNAALAHNAPPVIAIRMTDSHGDYHYIRVPPKYTQSGPWTVKMDVSEDVIDYVADKPEDTLLCPRFYVTSVS